MILPRLYAIADAVFGDPVDIASQLFAGGARLVQIRNKKASSRELLHQVEAVLRDAPGDATVLVNDRLDIALIARAHGVHLGQDDLSPMHARAILGENAVIGLSTHSLEQALMANALPVNYIAAGPVFATTLKENADPEIGLEGLRAISDISRKPVVAIGGITLERATEVHSAGVGTIAVISDLLKVRNIAERTRRWIVK